MEQTHFTKVDESLGNAWGQRIGKFADTYWPFLVITFGAAFIYGIPFTHWVW